MKHRHHIVPRHRGGGDEESNIVELTVTQHAMWHYAEWRLHGLVQDKLAWRGLAGICAQEEIVVELMRAGQRKAVESSLKTTSRLVKEGKFVFQNPEVQRKAIESSRKTQRLLAERGEHILQSAEVRAKKAKLDSEKQKALWELGKNALQQPDVVKRARASCSSRMSAKNSELFVCPHCGKSGRGMANMKRYHFDKCKTLSISHQ